MMKDRTSKQNLSSQRADEIPTSEGATQGQRVGPASPVTTPTNPMASVVIKTTPHTHQQNTYIYMYFQRPILLQNIRNM